LFKKQFELYIADRSDSSNSYQMMWAKVQIEDLEDENLEIDFHYPNSKEESI